VTGTHRAWLAVEGAESAQRIPLGGAPLVLGRGAPSDIRIPDRSLSGQHCRFEPAEGGGWKVVDLQSRNGTYVNEVLVRQRLLQPGDLVRLGRVGLRFVVETATAATPHARSADLSAQRLQAVVTALIEERRPQTVIDMVLDAVIEFTGAERGFFILLGDPLAEDDDEAGSAEARGPGEPRIVAARNFDREAVRESQSKVSRTVQRKALETGKPLIVVDASTDERFSAMDSVAGMRLRSILVVPVRGRAGPIGLIYLDNRFEKGIFEERQLPLLRMFADQAAIALRNAALHQLSAGRLEELAKAKAEVEELNRILSDRVARTSAELHEVKGQVLRDRAEAPLKYSYGNIVAKSRRMQDLFHLLDKVTDSDVPVLIQGESGTGKELVARAIHFNGPRKDRPFVSENCAAIPETLLESELFGYMRGAFTGATADKKGLFEEANGGTLFLDEIGDMSLEMQKKLLRVLQEREVRPVGGKRATPIDVRILAASNQNLRRMAAEGKFREDLYYRLNVITVEVPPLRDRAEDIPLLVVRFLEEFAKSNGVPPKAVSEDVMRIWLRYPWPGNVRELRNEVHRAAALSDRVIVPLVLSEAVRGTPEDPGIVADLGQKALKDMVKDATEEIEKRVIAAALRQSRGRKSQAARLLGISRPTLDAKIEAYGLEVRRDA
jgi:transcriptional regulator with GAF, ATPase, and Fis domain